MATPIQSPVNEEYLKILMGKRSVFKELTEHQEVPYTLAINDFFKYLVKRFDRYASRFRHVLIASVVVVAIIPVKLPVGRAMATR